VHAVRLWLVAAAAMIFLTLVVGGATRLTISGLSIVEWQPAAVHRGLVNELAEPNELVEDAIAVARELALLSPPAFAQTKLQLRAAITERMARSREATDKVVN
jgi:hypothetical protein